MLDPLSLPDACIILLPESDNCRADMPAINRPTDRADMLAIYKPDNDSADTHTIYRGPTDRAYTPAIHRLTDR